MNNLLLDWYLKQGGRQRKVIDKGIKLLVKLGYTHTEALEQFYDRRRLSGPLYQNVVAVTK